MAALRSIGPWALCAACLLALPGAAAAAEPTGETSLDARVLLLLVEASNGYEAELATYGDRVLLAASRGNVGAAYEVGGTVSDERIEASFGKLGRISGRYERVNLLGRREKPGRNGCEAPFSFVRFEGTLSFRGEQGYTTIETRRTGGLLLDPGAIRCRQRARANASAGGSGLNTYLAAISKHQGIVTSFSLARGAGDSRGWLEAIREERRGAMQIFRVAATLIGGPNALIASGPGVRPPFAFVAAPKPFSGSAIFDPTAAPGGEWSGTLSAWMPGIGKVSLAGPGYALSFCRRTGDEPGCDPEAPVRRELSAVQGSGSQSQLLAEARLSWSRYLRNSANSAGSTP